MNFEGQREVLRVGAPGNSTLRKRSSTLNTPATLAEGVRNRHVFDYESSPDQAPTSQPYDYVIFTVAPYLIDTQNFVETYWEAQGHRVSVVNLTPYDPSDRQQLIIDLVDFYNTTYNTIYFHIIGDHSDGFYSNVLWNTNEYWQAMRDSYDSFGFFDTPLEDPVLSIPTFVIPDAERTTDNVARNRPFLLSDQPYGDLDGNGIPDVVITRWPVESVTDIVLAAEKMQIHNNGENLTFGTLSSVFFVGDANQHGNDGVFVNAMAEQLMNALSELEKNSVISPLYQMDILGHFARQDSATAFLNRYKPGFVSLLAAESDPFQVADFLGATNSQTVGYPIEELNENNVLPLILAASCETADWTRTTQGERPVCDQFLFESDDRGSVAWIGAPSGTMQWANYTLSKYLIEELYSYPARSMGQSWLFAIQRAHADLSDPDDLLTIESYVFLGDPISPFRKVPTASISSYVLWVDTDSLGVMPDYVANGCPQGDANHIVFRVEIDTLQTPTDFAASDISITQPSDTNITFWGSLNADTIYTLPNGDYRAEVVIENFSALDTCGLDSVDIYLREYHVGKAYINVKSYDVVYGGTTGAVDISDFGEFSSHYPSSICDCISQKTYTECFDYWAPGDTAVGVEDFSLFAEHYLHSYTPPGGSSPYREELAYSTGSISLTIEEDYPLQGQRTLDVSVSSNDMEPVKVMILSFNTDNPVPRVHGVDRVWSVPRHNDGRPNHQRRNKTSGFGCCWIEKHEYTIV